MQEDKVSILQFIKKNPDAVDVQIMLYSNTGPDAESRIIEKIREKDGFIPGDPYRLTDGTAVIRAILSNARISEIAEDPGVYRIEKTCFFNGSYSE